MALLVDLFGYLSIVLHGASLLAQSMAVGGTLFVLLLARPFATALPNGADVVRRSVRLAAASALALAACAVATVGLQAAVLVDTVELPLAQALGASSAIAEMVLALAALALAGTLGAERPAPRVLQLALVATILGAAALTTHAVARLSGNVLLVAATLLHMLGAALWIGGIPSFVTTLRRLHDGAALRRVGARFSRMSMVGVGCIAVSALVFWFAYIGSWSAAYGTAYGVMVSSKATLFAALLLLGLGNFLVVERLRADPATPVLRLRRFAEVEIGLGVAVFFAAASLTSVPPAADLSRDRVAWGEIAARNAPVVPRLSSPDHDALALSALQTELDKDAGSGQRAASVAFVPGSGAIPDRNAADIAWSEYNHHWAGLFVLGLGILALLLRAGARWARHWPLAFLVLAGFLFLRADPEVRPLGSVGFFASLRDVEVLQHRVFELLIVAFGFFEWGVRSGRLASRAAALVFPLLCFAGGVLLLTHNHAIANVREQLLIEISHTPLALAAIAAGALRWLELRADGAVRRWAGWAWPLCFIAIGLILLDYREA